MRQLFILSFLSVALAGSLAQAAGFDRGDPFARAAAPAQPAPETSRNLAVPGRGISPEVLAYQRKLIVHCPQFGPELVTGVKDAATRAALEKFQAAYGLEVDGLYGPETAGALEGEVTGACHVGGEDVEAGL